jgi:hypothetical protein
VVDDRIRNLIRGHEVTEALEGFQQEQETEPSMFAPYDGRRESKLFQYWSVPAFEFAGVEAALEPGISGVTGLHEKNL